MCIAGITHPFLLYHIGPSQFPGYFIQLSAHLQQTLMGFLLPKEPVEVRLKDRDFLLLLVAIMF